MKRTTVVMLGLMFGVASAHAEDTIVIDARMLNEMPGAPVSETLAAPPPQNDAPPVQEEASRELLLNGHKLSARQQREIAKAELADKNKKLGEDYLAINKARPGVVTLSSGVQYKVVRAGKGAKPAENDVIMCRYTGTLIDGSTFASSSSRKPVPAGVSTLIPGLKEAVKLMSAGAKWQIVIPPGMAYGEVGNRGVGPNAVLIYDMEIAKIR